MKKIACVLGSPRRGGNSEAIAAKILETVQNMGAESKTFALNELTFKGCQACMACKTGKEECVIMDELKDVLAAARQADVLVMTSPLYFGQVTAQLKGFIDRAYSFFKPDYGTNPDASRLASGKKCVFITTQGHPDPALFDITPMYEAIFKRLGYDEVISIRGIGLSDKTAAAASPELMAQAVETAKQVLA